RVDDEVEYDLFDLTGIGDDADGVFRADHVEVDVGFDQPADHLFHPADDVPERDQPRIRRLAPAEGEQLARETGPALDSLFDLCGFVLRRTVGDVHHQEVGGSHDAHQDVVEVMRDAAGEPADRLELLRL